MTEWERSELVTCAKVAILFFLGVQNIENATDMIHRPIDVLKYTYIYIYMVKLTIFRSSDHLQAVTLHYNLVYYDSECELQIPDPLLDRSGHLRSLDGRENSPTSLV